MSGLSKDLHLHQPILFRRLKLVLLGGGAGLACGLLYLVNPADASFLPCPFRAITGWNCPACGATRAAHQLLHGNLIGALHLNLLLVLALPFFAWAGWSYFRAVLNDQPWRGVRFAPRVTLLIFAVMLGFTIIRNIPVSPFTLLSP